MSSYVYELILHVLQEYQRRLTQLSQYNKLHHIKLEQVYVYLCVCMCVSRCVLTCHCNLPVHCYWRFFKTPEVGIIGIFLLLKHEYELEIDTICTDINSVTE